MKKTYAKILSPTSISTTPPKSAIVDGKLIVGKLPEDYLASIEFYPYEEQSQPEVQTGYHLEERYEHIDGKTVKTWVQVEDPPVVEPTKVYSKVKILLAAQEAGFIDPLIDFIESNRTIEYIWNASNTIEDNELLSQYIESIGTALGKTEKEIFTFLNTYCLAD